MSHPASQPVGRVCRFRSYGATLLGLMDPIGRVRPIPRPCSLEEALVGVSEGQLGLRHTLDPLPSVELLAPVTDQFIWGVADQRTGAVTGATVAEAGRRQVGWPSHEAGAHLGATGARRAVASPTARIVLPPGCGCSVAFTIALWRDRDSRVLGAAPAVELRRRDGDSRAPAAKPWAFGPAVVPWSDLPPADDILLDCSIDRDGEEVWAERIAPSDAVEYLSHHGSHKDERSPAGAVELLPPPVVSPRDFGLRPGDVVSLGAGCLGNLAHAVGLTP